MVDTAKLSNREVLHVTKERPVQIKVLGGTAYITREGDFEDYIVREGEDLCIKDHGLVVVQGFPTVEFRVSA